VSSREFRSFLYGRAWRHAEGPVALFNHAVTWLRKNLVLLAGRLGAGPVGVRGPYGGGAAPVRGGGQGRASS
jgi:hypothetical protein